jgi:hypothetical protein
MSNRMFKMIAAVTAILLVAALPAVAGVANEGRRIEASGELVAFFQERGVDAIYLGKSRAEMPAAQWSRIVKIVNAPDVEDLEDDEPNVDDDHDVLNSLVFKALWSATDKDDDPVYITLGNMSWCHECGVDEEEQE